MALKIEDVLAQLDLDEPDYTEAAKMGPDAIPHLDALVAQDEPRLASKAAYLAGLISSEQSASIVTRAAQSQHADVRVAAAAAVRHLQGDAAHQVATTLLGDEDIGVRKVTLQSAATIQLPSLRARIEELASSDPEPFLQQLARETVQRMA